MVTKGSRVTVRQLVTKIQEDQERQHLHAPYHSISLRWRSTSLGAFNSSLLPSTWFPRIWFLMLRVIIFFTFIYFLWWWVCLASPIFIIHVVNLCVISPITSLLKGCKVLIQFLVFGRAAAFGAVFQGLASEPLTCKVVLIRIYITRLGHLG